MLIIPAIDLIGGVCVRLMQGKFDAVTEYGDPIAQVRAFARAGAALVHVVDLDGARAGAPAQGALIARLAAESGVGIQCGGGVRARADVEALLAQGAARVVIGSLAVRASGQVRAWITEFGAERICVALDVRRREGRWEIAADGWAADSGRTLEQVLAAFPPGALAHALVTDISRDGALTGPNLALIAELRAARADIAWQASGGVASLEDLAALKRAGASGAIVGRALYERRFTLEDALAL